VLYAVECVQSQKTAQNSGKTPIFEKSADQSTFREFAPLSERLHALGTQRRFDANKQSGPIKRGQMVPEGWELMVARSSVLRRG